MTERPLRLAYSPYGFPFALGSPFDPALSAAIPAPATLWKTISEFTYPSSSVYLIVAHRIFLVKGFPEKSFCKPKVGVDKQKNKDGHSCPPPSTEDHSIGKLCFSTGLVCFFGSVTVSTPLSSFALMPSRSISETSNDLLYSPKVRSQRR